MTVRNWLTTLREKIVYISPDGVTYNLHDPASKAVVNTSGWGMPTPSIADSRGPFQHGTNPLTIRVQPRTVRVHIRYNGCSRNEYWAGRAGLIDVLRWNRTNVNNPSPGHLRWYRADGTIRQVDVFVVSGPDFPQPDGRWDMFGYSDTLEFLANNPILYDPSQSIDIFSDLGCTIVEQLVFPYEHGTGGILFGVNSCDALNTRTINYGGTWQEFPLITVVGPAENFKITHLQTGLYIELLYLIPSSDSAVFDLRYGVKTVTLSSSGASLLGYISPGSSLGAFAIEPAPIVTGGINSFEVYVKDGTGLTQVQFRYYDRYIGI